MEENKKKLNVIALSDSTCFGEAAVRYGALLADIFQGQLIIISNFRLRKREFGKDFSSISSDKKTLPTDLLQKENIAINDNQFDAKSLYFYAEENNVGLFVIGATEKEGTTYFSRKKAFKFILPSRQPVMVVGEHFPTENTFKNVLLPLDLRPQNKEKVLWAGYFNRFNDAAIHILYSYFKEKHLQEEIAAIVAFAKKLYANLEIENYEIHQIEPTIDNMDKYSVEYAPQVNGTLTVILMTHNRSLGDFILGVREKTLIGNAEGFPVLCINERPDLYVLCT
ncbi:MAG: universal stress protein [Bacteroidales bacterium]|nr:universal stress protein [Bacteroidales bacterium]